VCDLETSRIGAPYIHDISNLRVNLFTSRHGVISFKTSIFKYTNDETTYMADKEGNGKAIPLQAWTGPEGSRRLRLPDFKSNGT